MAVRTLRTLAELKAELDAADAASKRSHAEYNAVLNGFVFDPSAVMGKLPRDPRSADYREAQLRLYETIAERGYQVANEDTPFDHAEKMRLPFPYATQSPEIVGNYLMTYGNLIKTMGLPLHARILEIGSGYGPLTYQLASMGYSVTCVDVSEKLLAYVRARTEGLPGRVETLVADMNHLELEGSFDAILFFESFHHCADHIGLLKRLPALLEPGGMLVLAGEPIVPKGTPAVPYPWGLRTDGLSLWFISRLGWIELGFEESYLLGLLESLGWSVVRKPAGSVATMGVWIAKRKVEDSPFAHPMNGEPFKIWKAGDPALRSEAHFGNEGNGEIASHRQTGYLLFGPYVPLETGFYEAQWYGEAEPGSKLQVDVACMTGTRIIRALPVEIGTSKSTRDNSLLARLRFKVDEPAPDFEFRLRVETACEVRMDSVVLHRC